LRDAACVARGTELASLAAQEMGEEPGEGDEVVDEKLWGEDEERPNDPNAKTEKDAPVKVSSLMHGHAST